MALITVTMDTEYGVATVRDMPSGLKAVSVMRPDKPYRVGTIAPMTNGRFYAVPAVPGGPSHVARSVEHAAEWLSTVYGEHARWSA